MNAPSPADRVEAALTPPWGPRLDHFLAARDEMKRPAPAQAPDTFRQEYVFQGDWHPDSEGFLAPDPNGPRPEDPVGMCTCSDLPAVMEAEVLPPAEAGFADATPAAALVPEVPPIRRIHLGGFTVDAWDAKRVAAVKAGPLKAEELQHALDSVDPREDVPEPLPQVFRDTFFPAPQGEVAAAPRPVRRLAVGPGHLAFIPTDPAVLHRPAEIPEGVPPPVPARGRTARNRTKPHHPGRRQGCPEGEEEGPPVKMPAATLQSQGKDTPHGD